MAKFATIKEATQSWVGEFNALPHALIEKAYPHMEGLEELTPRPKIWMCDECNEEFSQEEIDEMEENDNGNFICPTCHEDEDMDVLGIVNEVEDEDSDIGYGLPMWGTLWNPKESLDEDWIRENLEAVADCGFRIYESDEVGIILGIDGAGYDFYENHWIPLYRARGLMWHTFNYNV